MVNKINQINNIPVLVTRGSYIFPKCEQVLEIGRIKSINAIKASLKDFNGTIILISQKNTLDDEPSIKDIYTVGVVAELNVEKE